MNSVKNVVVVEDEKHAASHLEGQLKKQGLNVVAQLDSVKNTAKWLANNPVPDLLFMDIQLGDGLSFEVFDIVKVKCPVIFTTAFNQYAIDAFKVNSIAYLLKPIEEEELIGALAKYDQMQAAFTTDKAVRQIDQVRSSLQSDYKSRFIIKVGEHLRSVPVEDIEYFYSEEKTTFIRTKEARSLVLDSTLEQVSDQIDPHQFFRINRKYLVSFRAIEDIVSYRNSRLLLKLRHLKEQDAIVSREKVAEFKQWLDR